MGHERNITSLASYLSALLEGFHDLGDRRSLYYGFAHRNDEVSHSSSDKEPKALENTLLAIAAAGAVLQLLFFPLFTYLRTRSLDSVCRLVSVPSLWTGLANSAIWMIFTSFVMNKNDSMELIIVYPMLLAINFIYLMFIYAYKRSYVKAISLSIVVFVSIGYLFYVIRFRANPPIHTDVIACMGLLILLIFNTCLLKDLVGLHGFWEYLASFMNVGFTLFLNIMAFYVVVKKYPVQYFPVLSSFMGIIWGLTQILFMAMSLLDRPQNGVIAGENDDGGDNGDEFYDAESELSNGGSEDEDEYYDAEDDEAGPLGNLIGNQLVAAGGGNANQPDEVLHHHNNQPLAPHVTIFIPEENLSGSQETRMPSMSSEMTEENIVNWVTNEDSQSGDIVFSPKDLPRHQEIGMPSLSPTMTEGNNASRVKETCQSGDMIFSSLPSRKRKLKDKNVLSSVKWARPSGRILREDIKKHIDTRKQGDSELGVGMLRQKPVGDLGEGSDTSEKEINEVEKPVKIAVEGSKDPGKISIHLKELLEEARRRSAEETRIKKPVMRRPAVPVRKKPWIWMPGICCQVE